MASVRSQEARPRQPGRTPEQKLWVKLVRLQPAWCVPETASQQRSGEAVSQGGRREDVTPETLPAPGQDFGICSECGRGSRWVWGREVKGSELYFVESPQPYVGLPSRLGG